MNPEEKEEIRKDLAGYIIGTIDEWLRLADFETSREGQARQYRIRWEQSTDNAMIASVSYVRDVDPLVRFGVQIDVETLPDLPPIGPENDLGIYGIDESEPAPEWAPATLAQCLAGDHIRIGTDETDVVRCSSGIWHADSSDAWRPKKWNHLELRMELAANPKQPGVERSGFCEYPPNLPCEILCTPERKVVLLLQSAFSGSAVISSDVD